MTAPRTAPVLLTIEQAAQRLNTSPRFIRRLIAERRVDVASVGHQVRSSGSELVNFIEAGRVATVRCSRGRVA